MKSPQTECDKTKQKNVNKLSDYHMKSHRSYFQPLIRDFSPIWSPDLKLLDISSDAERVLSSFSSFVSRSSSVYLSLKEEDVGEGTEGKEMESGPDEVMTESYMTMAQSENCRLVDASIQKNISFDGKPMTPTGWNGGVGEIFSLRDQLKQAEEKASQVQREVRHWYSEKRKVCSRHVM